MGGITDTEIKNIEFVSPVVYGVNVEWHDGTSVCKCGFATSDVAYEWAMNEVAEKRALENKRFVPKSVKITSSLR